MSSTACAGFCADSAEKPTASTTFEKVLDGRKQPIRGLWRRGNTYYARLTCETPEGNSVEKRIALQAVTVAEAKLAMEQLRYQKAAGILTVKRSTPLFNDYTTTYLANARLTKRPNTVKLHTWVLRDAARLMGEIRLHQINEATLNRLRAKKLAEGCSPRTANVVVGAVVCVLHYAVTENLIKEVPTSKKLRETPKRKRLVTLPEVHALCDTALKRLLNGRQFADYLTLLAFSGLRCSEALELRWEDISFDRQQLTVGAATVTKNGESRVVDFNAHLQLHLEEMLTRRTPDSPWLFPNASLKGKQPIKSFHCHMKRLKKAMKIEEFGFHHLRHFYASMCLMSGADFGTVAAWLGHKDNGALLARTYSHLADEHRKLMAAKVVFEPVIQTASDRLQLQAA